MWEQEYIGLPPAILGKADISSTAGQRIKQIKEEQKRTSGALLWSQHVTTTATLFNLPLKSHISGQAPSPLSHKHTQASAFKEICG